MAPDVAILADAGPGAGLGHVSRSGALAHALRARGADVACAVVAGEGLEWDGIAWAPPGAAAGRVLVVDSYELGSAAGRELAGGRPLARFHDEGEPPDADLIVADACLRPAFWGIPPRTPGDAVRRVLVAVGGGAASGGAALAAAVRDLLPEAAVRLVAGPYADEAPPEGVEVLHAPPGLAGELLAADLVLTAAGQTMLEALCCGAPTVAVAVASNQAPQLERLAAAGAVVAATAAAAGDAVAALAADAGRRTALARAGQRAIDGYGALREAWRVAALA
jgi:spore coat polysaccharide biosynthesis predicted glycosyltransferase SpsG